MPDSTDPPDGQDPGLAVEPLPAAPSSSPATAQDVTSAARLALEAGWTMAVLYRNALTPDTGPEHPGGLLILPTANELPPGDRRKLELARLRDLLTRLAKMPEFTGSPGPPLPAGLPPAGREEALHESLATLNLGILCALAAARPETRLAYEVGRSLRDTADPPDQHPPTDALSAQFARDRITTIQGWLAALASELPPKAAAVVAASLGRWREFAAVMAGGPTPRLQHGDSANAFEAMYAYLLRQGDLWLMLLTGARPTAGLLSPDGFVAAGELALRRSTAIVLRILRRYWGVLLTGAVALGVILYLAVTYLGGAAKVWTSIAAIAGSLGISARAIASRSARLAAEAEQPIFAAAEEDVMAWAITTMPQVRLNRAGVRQLRRSGIAPTSSLGRV